MNKLKHLSIYVQSKNRYIGLASRQFQSRNLPIGRVKMVGRPLSKRIIHNKLFVGKKNVLRIQDLYSFKPCSKSVSEPMACHEKLLVQ